MDNNKYSLNENQIKTILAVFGDLKSIPYEELNKRLGSITIDRMYELYGELKDWRNKNIFKNEEDIEQYYDPIVEQYYDPYYDEPYDENGIYY